MSDPPGSTDDQRTAGPLRHARVVRSDEPLSLKLGGELPEVEIAYETWGELNPERDNAVLVCHAISGDSHAARHDADDEPGWWEGLIGPGAPIDTDRFYVVCPNVLGGCRGSTGPGSLDPRTGRRYGPDFPPITLSDIVATQARLADRLEIDRWRAVVGGSLGGQQAMTWAIEHPERVQTCVAVATTPRLSSQALAFDVVGRNAIRRDPGFAGGRYEDTGDTPQVGLAIARMLGHLTYLSAEAMEAKFDPDRHDPHNIQTAFEKRFSVGTYLAHQGQKFVARFDANAYLTLSMAMDLFDLGQSEAELRATLERSTCDWQVVSFSSDWLFPPEQSRVIVDALASLGRSVSYCEITTDAGHDAFLLERDIDLYGPMVAARLGEPDPHDPDLRDQDRRILDLIPQGSSVLDLGCGSGRLLAGLRRRGDGPLMGVEVAQDKLIAAARRGLDVIDLDLNRGLDAFADGQFDAVVLSATLQAVDNVEVLMDAMLRVGRRVVVSFANFAHKDLRRQYCGLGRVPKAKDGDYGFDWWDTPNRRFPTILDFADFCDRRGIAQHQWVYLDTAAGTEVHQEPNLHADLAIVVLSRAKRPANETPRPATALSSRPRAIPRTPGDP
ncbi:MAG: homoserine O-acetyltransferase [Planctomycetota bacterium]